VSRFKGGTIIDEDVLDLEDHERRVRDPDRYRPERCPRCGHGVLHVHGYPERQPRGELGMPAVVRIVLFLCAASACGATWRILPRFLARHLWRAWTTVERVLRPDDKPVPKAPIPPRTAYRWRSRIAAAARVLVVLLAVSGGLALESLAADVGLDATRAELVEAHAVVVEAAPGMRLAAFAALAHRLERGLRLM
jgi:hypothetical protein